MFDLSCGSPRTVALVFGGIFAGFLDRVSTCRPGNGGSGWARDLAELTESKWFNKIGLLSC